MAILDEQKNKKPFLNDRDEDVFIGLRLPLVLDNNKLASTTTTLDAIKNNLQNFLSTEQGERVMQPNLGVGLKKFLFEPYSDEMVVSIQTTIIEALGYWMPFIRVNDIQVSMSANETGDFRSVLEVSVDFSLKKDPTTVESIQVNIGE
jgi:phage baseplate assembly protein W